MLTRFCCHDKPACEVEPMAGLIVLTFWGLLFNKKVGEEGRRKGKKKKKI